MCTLCWDNTEKTLTESITSAYQYNPSNCKAHIQHVHNKSDNFLGLNSDIFTITNADLEAKTKVQKKTQQSSMLSYQQNPEDIATPQIALSYLYCFFNETNVAIMQANNEHLSKFIQYIIESSHQLRARQSECLFSRYKYMNQRDDRFLKFVSSLKELVNYSRDDDLDKFSKTVPFICISHDGWDSKDHDILGVCVRFIVPAYWKVINIAAGLKRIRSKKSVATAKSIHLILER